MVRRTRKEEAARTCRDRVSGEPKLESTDEQALSEASLTPENTRVAAHSTERMSRGCRGCWQNWHDLQDTVSSEDEPGTQQNGFSQAMAWMLEPEWNGESSESLSETSAGSREPECGVD